MAIKTINQLDDATIPISKTDKILVSRDGINVTKTTVGDIVGNSVIYVGNSSIDLKNALLSATDGQILILSKSALYLVENPTDFHFSADISIIGNNSTIAPSNPNTFWAASNRTLMQCDKLKINTGTIATPISVTSGQANFNFDNSWGYTPQVGDKITFYSNDIWLSNGQYKHGMIATITAVSGLTAYLSTPFYANFSVNRVEVYSVGSVKIENLKFDMTGVVAGLSYGSHGLIVRGATNPHLERLTFIGNTYSQIGVGIYNGEGGFAVNCNAYNFWNEFGISGGGRLGYGINIAQSGFVVKGGTWSRCKHACAIGASRDYRILAASAQDMLIYEDIRDIATAVGGSLDAHAGYIGRPVFKNNQIYCLKQAFNIRGGSGLIEDNTITRISSDTSALVSSAGDMPYDGLEIINNIISHPNGAPIIGRTWGTTENCNKVDIYRNKISGGGTLVSIGSIDSILSGWNIKENTISFPVGATIDINFLGNGKLQNSSFSGNKVTSVSSGFINLQSASVGIAKQASLSNVELRLNNVSITGGTTTTFILTSYLSGNDVSIEDNYVNHTTEATSININSSSITRLKINRNRTINGIIKIGQSGTTGTPDTYQDLELYLNSIIGVSSAIQIQESTEDIVFTGSSRISSNTCRLSGSARAVVWTNRIGSTAWASPAIFEFSGNNLNSASSVAVIQISANSTGHKILFRNNQLSAPIEDLSGTYYNIPLGNTIKTGTQPWKGGTQFRQNDSSLRATSIPTTGSWSVGDIVWNLSPTNSAGQPIGWVNVVDGIPGTWRPFGNTI